MICFCFYFGPMGQALGPMGWAHGPWAGPMAHGPGPWAHTGAHLGPGRARAHNGALLGPGPGPGPYRGGQTFLKNVTLFRYEGLSGSDIYSNRLGTQSNR